MAIASPEIVTVALPCADVDLPGNAPGVSRGRDASGATVLGLVVGLWGVLIGLGPLGDNSFFTHLQTGRLILEHRRVPTTDPYSFTAEGTPWVVYSWLASALYAGLDAVGGFFAIRLVIAVTAGSLALLVWRLCRPAESIVGRIGVVALAVFVGSGYWVERPLLFGLLFLAIFLVAAEGGLDPRWLVPVMWLWVNMHGSFPLGLLALVCFAVGRKLDGRHPTIELRALRWAGIGLLVAALNPLGLRILVFPIDLLRRSSALSTILEWKPPAFDNPVQKVFLIQLFVAVVLLVRKPSYRAAIPLAVFGLMSLLYARNLPPASLVLLPGMAAAIGGAGSIAAARRSRSFSVAACGVGCLAVAIAGFSLSGSSASLDLYPTSAVAWLEKHEQIDPGVRLVAQDYVGNYLEVMYGPDEVRVFIDDRVDMFPDQVIRDYATILHGDRGWDEVLDRNRADLVLWHRDKVLTQLIEASPEWRVVYRDTHWMVAVPKMSTFQPEE